MLLARTTSCKLLQQWVDTSFADLLQVQGLPTWPAASTLLLRCMHTLGSSMGMQHSDASVRQISIDLVGSIAAHLHRCNLAAEADQEWLAQMAVPDGKANALNHGSPVEHRSALLEALLGAVSLVPRHKSCPSPITKSMVIKV